MLKSKIVFKLTGSIACFKAAQLISRLVQEGCEVQTVCTPEALKFIGAATLEGLSGKPVLCDTFEQGRAMDHISVMRWADQIIVCPATANTINKFAAGLADDLVSCMFLAHDFKKPYIIAPAMNTAMYQHPTTQKSLLVLKEMGIKILDTDLGALACGEVGPGRLLDLEKIYSELTETKKNSQSIQADFGVTQKNILITGGGTSEPIDSVRAITNTSSGKTAARLCDEFVRAGYKVTFLHSEKSVQPSQACDKKSFNTFSDLQESLRQMLRETQYAAVIHAAAVSDYTVAHVKDGKGQMIVAQAKIETQSELNVGLKQTPKLVNFIKEWSSNPGVQLIAFKLTDHAQENEIKEKVSALKIKSQADIVVHNDLSQITKVKHVFNVYKNSEIQVCEGAQALAQYLKEQI